jgi:hypothetical protein
MILLLRKTIINLASSRAPFCIEMFDFVFTPFELCRTGKLHNSGLFLRIVRNQSFWTAVMGVSQFLVPVVGREGISHRSSIIDYGRDSDD